MKKIIFRLLLLGIFFATLFSCRHTHSTNEYVVDPTCTQDGYKVIETCCKEPIINVIPALGHNYVDGICKTCSEKEELRITIINGTESNYITLKYGEVINVSNYDFLNINNEYFEGWYKDGKLYDFNDIITTSFTLTAKYFDTVTVTFQDDDGTILDVKTILKNDSIINSIVPFKEYYEFIGWDKSLNNIENDLTVTALYKLKKTQFNIEYNIDNSLLYYSSKEDLLNDFLKDFYDFVNPDISFHAFCNGIEGSDPVWTNYIGGSFSNNNFLIYNNSIDLDDDNYFFNSSKYKTKWYKLSSYVKNYICKSNKRFGYENVEYHFGALDFYRYMTNNPDKYVDVYGGETLFHGYPLNDVNLITSYEYNKEDIILYQPSNKSFGGWYKDDNFTDGPYTIIDSNSVGDIVLYAKTVTNYIYKIEFDTKTSQTLKPIYLEENEGITLPTLFKDGSDFLGWYLDYEEITNGFVFQSNACLVAKWDDPDVIENNYIVYNGKTITYRNSYVAVEIPDTYVEKDTELRACWVSSFVNNFTPSVNKEKMINELTYVLDMIESMNMNCLIFHVRTHNNAFYQTNLAPIPSNYGTYESFEDWDYLKWLINECHNRGIEFHAWLNPYRIKLYGVSYEDNAQIVSNEYSDYPLNHASNPDNILLTYYTNASGGAILNPAKQVVQDYIVNVCLELALKYNIDAIHFDDYFYQRLSYDNNILEEANQNDYLEFINNNPGIFNPSSETDKENWRRMNVNNLIEKIHIALSLFNYDNNKNIKFGISPTATYKSGDGSVESGSNTGGGGHYNKYLYADTVKWINEEWIDYIIPQCYTSFNYTNFSFHEITSWWNKVVDGKNCNLYIGMGLYNSYESDYSYSWKTEPDELINQLLYLNTLKNVKGVALYSFSSMKTIFNNTNIISHSAFMKLKNELWLNKTKVPYNE